MHVPPAVADRILPRLLALAQRQTTSRALTIEHFIRGVTPQQITWWWGHIDTTERFRLWHPRNHLAFAWEVAPSGTHIGSILVVREVIGLIPATLRIRFDNPAGIKTAFPHLLVAAVIDREGLPILRFVHAYEDAAGGTRMRSTFHLPPILYALMGSSLRQHNYEKMTNLSTFLPRLYTQERGR